MSPTNQKNQIVESLNSLNNVQAEQVLNYIRDLQEKEQMRMAFNQKTRQKAMMEIRQALTQNRKLNPLF